MGCASNRSARACPRAFPRKRPTQLRQTFPRRRSGSTSTLARVLFSGIAALPASIGVGILKYRLYDLSDSEDAERAGELLRPTLREDTRAEAVLVTRRRGVIGYVPAVDSDLEGKITSA